MFSGFNLKLDTESIQQAFELDFNKYKKIGEEHLKSDINRFNSGLKDLINRKTINGSQLQEYCFPNIEAEIFLSHSHKDRDLANALAGWINESFGLKVFVDSNIWEYSGELLNELNSKYSNKRPNGRNRFLYDHESCCKASEHVNTMLSAALHKMIDRVECVILLNTGNSVQVFEDECFDSTYSPWIYSEIMCTQIVRKTPLLCYREYNELMHLDESTCFTYDDANLVVSYIMSLKHLVPIDFGVCIKWLYNYRHNPFEKTYPLDSLYSFTYKNHVEITKKLYHITNPAQIEKIKKYFSEELDESLDILKIMQILCGGK